MKKAGSGKYWEPRGERVEMSNTTLWCGSSCYWPEPGEEGRPEKPQLKAGIDFNYGTKTVTVKVNAPNPNRLKLNKSSITFSDRAKSPGGIWMVGTTVTMSAVEFNRYLIYLR